MSSHRNFIYVKLTWIITYFASVLCTLLMVLDSISVFEGKCGQVQWL